MLYIVDRLVVTSCLQPVFAGGGLTGETILNTLPPSGHWGNYLSDYSMFARPSWRQSELDVGKGYPDYDDQVAFKDREEVSKVTKGSTRPDFYTEGHSLEVKNYDLSTSSKRSNLVRVIVKQVNDRVDNLPIDTKKTVIIDIRGQTVPEDALFDIVRKIREKSKETPEVIFKRED
ncbi:MULTISPECIES: hypothetical protein [Bacillus]|uniref:hypothetical protein n=1 Tax=Bacillus TaxID=1386 RepID=UPI000B0B142A|nr:MULTISPECIES: hypothetical protein [Bacillus]MED1512047.1 hypothetical protein [Bacillus proteolyticus]